MTIEKDSIEFLENQIERNYKDICSKYLLDSVEWMEDNPKGEIRAYARLVDEDKLSNIVLLFPPFQTSKPTK